MAAVYAFPILFVIAALASRRVTLLQAAAGGLVLTLALVPVALSGERSLPAFLAREVVNGAWLAWHAIAVILAGLFFHNVAVEAIAMPIQKQLALQAGHPMTWVAAIQNAAGSNATVISPISIAMGAALVGIGGREGEIFRQALPIAGAALAVLLVAAGAVWAA